MRKTVYVCTMVILYNIMGVNRGLLVYLVLIYQIHNITCVLYIVSTCFIILYKCKTTWRNTASFTTTTNHVIILHYTQLLLYYICTITRFIILYNKLQLITLFQLIILKRNNDDKKKTKNASRFPIKNVYFFACSHSSL